jgi:hypothetical protein
LVAPLLRAPAEATGNESRRSRKNSPRLTRLPQNSPRKGRDCWERHRSFGPFCRVPQESFRGGGVFGQNSASTRGLPQDPSLSRVRRVPAGSRLAALTFFRLPNPDCPFATAPVRHSAGGIDCDFGSGQHGQSDSAAVPRAVIAGLSLRSLVQRYRASALSADSRNRQGEDSRRSSSQFAGNWRNRT